jgi:ferredoxin--NADP+ reductase
MEPPQDIPFDESTGTIRNEDGRVEDGVYTAGWARRGPTGVIGTNKPDGQNAAALLLEDIKSGSKPGRGAFETLLKDRDVRWVDFTEWKKIDDAEVNNAQPGAPREKFVTAAEMLQFLDTAS